MNLELEGRIALLVGGAGTIGQAVAGALRAEGTRAIIADVNLPNDLAHDQVAIDVTSQADVARCVDAVLGLHQRIDILVMLAGVYDGTPLLRQSGDDWDRVLAINLKGTFLCCREVLPHMQQSDYGRIICLGSLAGQVGGIVAGANYSASKAGVLSLVKTIAKQVGKPWITVNAINPGPVAGTMTDSWTAEERQSLLVKMSAGRFAQPAEIARLVAYLSYPHAALIHGAHLDINGGLYMD